LDDQFFYRWVLAEEKSLAVFLAFFRRSFALLGYVDRNAQALRNALEEATIIQPYRHAVTAPTPEVARESEPPASNEQAAWSTKR
jgi:hypothetical protein